MARDLFDYPNSIVTSAFSLGGKIISPIHSALKPMTVQPLVCWQEWRHSKYDTTPTVDNDSNLHEEGAYFNEENDTSPFFY